MPPGPTSGPTSRAERLLRGTTVAAVVTNVGIVISGGAVRLTGSGLGCPTWPTCDGTSFVPVVGAEHTTWQTAIEFGNRLLTFVVLAAALGVFVLVRRTRPHTRAVERLAWALPLGVLGQALLGGVTVLTGLSPLTVAAHFLLSMALIAVAVVLHERLRAAAAGSRPAAGLRRGTTALLVVAGAVLVLGTITTGAGPHGGDVSAPRFDIDIRLAAIAHADAVWLLLGLTVALVAVTWGHGPIRLRAALRLLLALELAQGIVGYSQYALGVPRPLVLLHVAGAALLWATAVAVWARAHPAPAGRQTPDRHVAVTPADRPPAAEGDGTEVPASR